MKCLKPIILFKNVNRQLYPDGLEVPCGKCEACRIQKRNEWCVRMIHELDSWTDAVFVTLTYSEDKIPSHESLVKSDLQKFFKRLRKKIEPNKIKYFACGEYGDQTNRPHYHAIIFGLSQKDHDIINECWGLGIIHTGIAEPASMRYVAKYIQKKLSGELAKEVYEDTNRESVFCLTSKGMGKNFVLKNAKQITDNCGFTLFGTPMSFPRYYLKILELENTDFRKIKSIEADMAEVEYFTDIEGLTFMDLYKHGKPDDIVKLVKGIKAKKIQEGHNINARLKIKVSKKI